MKTTIYILSLLLFVILFVTCMKLNSENVDLKEQLKSRPEIIWKEFRTTKYIEVEKPVEKVVYKTIYKEKQCINYQKEKGELIIEIKSNK